MILVLKPNTLPESLEYKQLLAHLANLPGISTRIHSEIGIEQALTEIYLIGNTKVLSIEDIQFLPCVYLVFILSDEYLVLRRHQNDPSIRRNNHKIISAADKNPFERMELFLQLIHDR